MKIVLMELLTVEEASLRRKIEAEDVVRLMAQGKIERYAENDLPLVNIADLERHYQKESEVKMK